jgi:hypothetical protein
MHHKYVVLLKTRTYIATLMQLKKKNNKQFDTIWQYKKVKQYKKKSLPNTSKISQ